MRIGSVCVIEDSDQFYIRDLHQFICEKRSLVVRELIRAPLSQKIYLETFLIYFIIIRRKL